MLDISKLQLAIDEVAALRDFGGLSSKKTLKLKQALEILIPELKGLVITYEVLSHLYFTLSNGYWNLSIAPPPQ